ncbi:unnamed protein product, partial [Mesorhabditis spiculigera]
MQWIPQFFIIFTVLADRISAECLQSERNLFLWQVTGPSGRQLGFLFGTIHVPYTRIWDRVSDRVKEAFERSESVFVEVDLQDEQTIRRLMKCKNLKKPRTSLQYLGNELHTRLQKYFANYRRRLISLLREKDDLEDAKGVVTNFNHVVGGWDRRRPEWLLFVLYQLCEAGIDREESQMLDAFLAELAVASGKEIYSIETPQEQCNPVESLSEEQLVFAINYTLSYLEYQLEIRKNPVLKVDRPRRTHDIVRSYECGSLEKDVFQSDTRDRYGQILNETDIERAREIDRLLKDDILVKRNVRMASRIDKLITSGGQTNFFAALGTGHFIGEKNIITLLEQRGYSIKAVKEDDVLLSHRKDANFRALWVREDPVSDSEDIEIQIEITSSFSGAFPKLGNAEYSKPYLIDLEKSIEKDYAKLMEVNELKNILVGTMFLQALSALISSWCLYILLLIFGVILVRTIFVYPYFCWNIVQNLGAAIQALWRGSVELGLGSSVSSDQSMLRYMIKIIFFIVLLYLLFRVGLYCVRRATKLMAGGKAKST